MPREIGLGWLKGRGAKVLDSLMHESYMHLSQVRHVAQHAREKHKNDLSKSESILEIHKYEEKIRAFV